MKVIEPTSSFHGVSRERGRWKAQVSVKNRTVRIGEFDGERDAALAYDLYVRELGERGFGRRLNFPQFNVDDLRQILHKTDETEESPMTTGTPEVALIALLMDKDNLSTEKTGLLQRVAEVEERMRGVDAGILAAIRGLESSLGGAPSVSPTPVLGKRPPIQGTKKYQVAQALRDAYRPGARLPTQAELCVAFGVGVAVIRDAEKILEVEGCVRCPHPSMGFHYTRDWRVAA